jgi:predicted acyl esterase
MRRQILARTLGLTPPRYAVGVRRAIAVPMPDGVILRADHYFPEMHERFPTVLIRSAYGRGDDAAPGGGRVFGLLMARFAERGYHVVVQTARGRFDSGGSFQPFEDDAADGQATIAWIAAQPWSDGQVAMWGPSYLGYVQWAAASDPARVPALRALAPQFIGSRISRLITPGGAFTLDTFITWIVLVDGLDHLRDTPRPDIRRPCARRPSRRSAICRSEPRTRSLSVAGSRSCASGWRTPTPTIRIGSTSTRRRGVARERAGALVRRVV